MFPRGSRLAVAARLPAPACPSVTLSFGDLHGTVHPAGMGFWGIWAHGVAFRGLWDLCSRQHLSPLRGLPGGGTAETDASQGKSTDQKAGRQSGGHRAWLGSRGSRPCGCSCPDCCRTHKLLQLAMGRDKRAKRDAKAQEQLDGRFSSLPACTEPTLGSEGIRLKAEELPHPSCRPERCGW